MKHRAQIFFAAAALFALPLLLLADTSIDYFSAKSTSSNVTVEWKTGIESAITKFDIERAAYGVQQFDKIGTVQAKGSYTYYSFVDESGFQKGVSSTSLTGLYQYRLRIYNADGTSVYSSATSVEHSVSSVRRTWGQIKEMFR